MTVQAIGAYGKYYGEGTQMANVWGEVTAGLIAVLFPTVCSVLLLLPPQSLYLLSDYCLLHGLNEDISQQFSHHSPVKLAGLKDHLLPYSFRPHERTLLVHAGSERWMLCPGFSPIVQSKLTQPGYL